MDRLVIKKARGLKGELTLPGDKSISHRAIIFSCLSSGKALIEGLSTGEDTGRTLEIFKQLGIDADHTRPHSLVIHGRGLHGLREPGCILYAGNSGTTMRLLTGLLSGQNFFSVMYGDDSLNRRPMRRVVEPLR
ncbi:MAG: 3-phosphoshikimate 1-carboxyvinyltransferase, partial [Pseudomonadota bacterium]